MYEVLVGNLCSLGAMVTDSISGTRKKQSEILGIQIASQLFYGAGSFILKGYSGTVQNLVAVVRNLAAIKRLRQKWAEWLLVALGVALGVLFNNRGLVGWLPIVANFEYSVAVFRCKDGEGGLKIALVVSALMFAVFSFLIRNYVGAAANAAVAVITALSLFGAGRKKSAEKE